MINRKPTYYTVTYGYKSRFGEGKNILNHAKFKYQEHKTKNWSLDIIGNKSRGGGVLRYMYISDGDV